MNQIVRIRELTSYEVGFISGGGPDASDFTVTNATAEDLDKLDQALDYLEGSDANPSQAVADANVTIEIIHDGNDRFDPNSNTVYWDPDSALGVIDSSTGMVEGVQSSALGLGHEFFHAEDYANDPIGFIIDASTYNSSYDNVAELTATNGEAELAEDLGEPTRDNHDGQLYTVNDPTQHTTDDSKWEVTNDDGTTTEFGEFTSVSSNSGDIYESPDPSDYSGYYAYGYYGYYGYGGYGGYYGGGGGGYYGYYGYGGYGGYYGYGGYGYYWNGWS
jgi:hypothetical protein